MKKIILAIIIGVLVIAVGTGIYFVAADKNDGTVSVTVDDFADNPDTLESLKCPGLYCTGELLDVVGDCGGYNLHWAWTTGYVVGNSIG